MYRIEESGRSHVLRISRGEDLVRCVQEYCKKNKVSAAWVQGLGACDKVVISFYNLETKEYEKSEFEEDFEVLSFLGNISVVDDEPFLHAHAVLGRRDKTTIGGHLNYMRISATGEMLITDFGAKFTRSKDEETGLSLLDGKKI